jgi:alpha,alpha-trehalase
MNNDRSINLDEIDGVIFDMDGVVTSSAREHASSWKRMFDEYLSERARRYGEKHEKFDTESDYRRYVDGKPRYEGASSFLESRNISLPYGNPEDPPDKETICGLGNRKNKYFLEHLRKYGAKSFKSTLSFIEKLKGEGIKVAVISASRNAREVMKAAGVEGIFDASVDGIDSSELKLKGKPEPDIFLEAARRLNVTPNRSIVIEDALAGVEAGRAGNFTVVVGIDRGEQAEELRKRGANIVVKDLSELQVRGKGIELKAAKLPSALEKKDEIFYRVRARRPIIFLDYDGTLTPIVADPDQALLPEKTKAIIKRLAEHWTVVIISGRSLSDVKEKVGLNNISYAGSHGFNIEGHGESFHDQQGQRFLPALDEAETELKKAVQDIQSVNIERKPYAIAAHYRSADDRAIPELEKHVKTVAEKQPDLIMTRGKKIFELRPNVDWDKGKALLYLTETLNVDGSRVLPIYIGDGETDEDAFQAIADEGIGIVVTENDRKTAAKYVLRDPFQTATFLEELASIAEKDVSRGVWKLVYQGFEPTKEKLREALCVTGNGYFATRGAAPESTAGEVHYPGTYIAGVYNRLKSTVAGYTIENESMVNIPNWLPLSFRIEDGDWFDLETIDILEYRQELDMRRGVLSRTVRFTDGGSRHTRVTQRRFVHMDSPHLAGLETTIFPEDWAGMLHIRSAIDGRVENTLVKRYRQLNNHHLEQIAKGFEGEDIIWLQVETNQSHVRIAEAARTRVFQDELPIDVERNRIEEHGYIGHEFDIEVEAREAIRVEKIISIYSSRDRGISESALEAMEEASNAADFATLLESHILGWDHLWERWHITLDAESQRMAQILNLHIFHLLQTVSPNTIEMDAGVPPRGLHGEAYRGLIMWDELFIFPLLNLRMPEITRALLRYRYRRLPKARRAAKESGYAGAMFPWQSGSNGREEAQVLHLNPESGRWIPDNTQMERHVNIAIAYNVWQYYQVTGDLDFMTFYGAEIIIELARFWASTTQYNRSLDRYEIRRVMGPDEFHDAYPDTEEPGIDNNSYTNAMVVWLMCRALDVIDMLPEGRRKILWESMGLTKKELQHWDDISHKMRIVFHDDGIISQFEGYGKLKEFDWDVYRKKYGDIHRLDRILEAEGDTPNRYKVSKQADVLMLFYLLSAEELRELFERLGYSLERDSISRNLQYYLKRTSHGSTLSRVVHSWVLSRSGREVSWNLFQDALESDVSDVQGGTTNEGIHVGAMAGTVDILQRSYAGIETRENILRFNPSLPKGLRSVQFGIKYRGHWLDIKIMEKSLKISSHRHDMAAISIGFKDEIYELKPGNTVEFKLEKQVSE